MHKHFRSNFKSFGILCISKVSRPLQKYNLKKKIRFHLYSLLNLYAYDVDNFVCEFRIVNVRKTSFIHLFNSTFIYKSRSLCSVELTPSMEMLQAVIEKQQPNPL